MLPESHPEDPEETSQNHHPEPGHLLDPTQHKQSEIKADYTRGEVQQGCAA